MPPPPQAHVNVGPHSRLCYRTRRCPLQRTCSHPLGALGAHSAWPQRPARPGLPTGPAAKRRSALARPHARLDRPAVAGCGRRDRRPTTACCRALSSARPAPSTRSPCHRKWSRPPTVAHSRAAASQPRRPPRLQSRIAAQSPRRHRTLHRPAAARPPPPPPRSGTCLPWPHAAAPALRQCAPPVSPDGCNHPVRRLEGPSR
eukprot:scaffold3767_cov114-Isochrysis_galbana.AAC.43